ncbi:MAG TPA: Wzz/FepE/Etk N-terminal domain-containing protein [Bacteroidia bacterium]|nr:Wzz/FepE/Etk N-terminal domain-containing protein [Bacteroidia bacterium]
MVENISATELIRKIVKWRKTFLIVSAVSVVLTGIVTILMPKQYKSTAILFAARQFSVSKLVIEANAGNQEDYMQIGDEDDCEKLIQLLTSDALKVKVADRLDLWKRWKIKDTTFAYHYLRLKWDDMVKIKRTEFNSVKVEVYDYTANGAAQIANTISELCDTVRRDMTRAVSGEVLRIVKAEYENTLSRMQELADSLQTLRNMGIMHYKEQVKAYSKSYAKALEKNDAAAIKRLGDKLDTLAKYGGAYQTTKDNLDKYSSKYPDIKMKYDEALVNYNTFIPAKFVVEKAVPNEYKAKPRRFIIILISVVACNLLALFALLLQEKMKSENLIQ